MKYILSKAPKKKPEYFLVLKKRIQEVGIECEVVEEGKELLMMVEEQDFETANEIRKQYREEIVEEIGDAFTDLLGEIRKVFGKK